MPDWLMPVDLSGSWAGEGLIPIDAAHRQGVPHKGAWLHVMTKADGHLLLVKRSPRMVTCPSAFSIIGEHHQNRESDEACAVRAVREELPGLAPLLGTPALELFRLRPTPRWFLFDYPIAGDGARRHDRCLISEFVLRLAGNSSTALARLNQGTRHEAEHEATTMEFVPLGQAVRRLRRHPESFCAPELFPAALVDSYIDMCDAWRRPDLPRAFPASEDAPLPAGCSKSEIAEAVRARNQPTMHEDFQLARVVRGHNHSAAAADAPGFATGAQRTRRLKAARQAQMLHKVKEAGIRSSRDTPHTRPRVDAARASSTDTRAAPSGEAAALVRRALEAAGLVTTG